MTVLKSTAEITLYIKGGEEPTVVSCFSCPPFLSQALFWAILLPAWLPFPVSGPHFYWLPNILSSESSMADLAIPLLMDTSIISSFGE